MFLVLGKISVFPVSLLNVKLTHLRRFLYPQGDSGGNYKIIYRMYKLMQFSVRVILIFLLKQEKVLTI